MKTYFDSQDFGSQDPRRTDAHLTDDQFADLLLGAVPASVSAHLSACPRCSDEAAKVSGALGSFAQQSRLWAERRASSRHAPLRDSQPAFLWLHLPQALHRSQAWIAAGLAIVLAFGVDVALRMDRVQPVRQSVAQVQPAAAVSPSAPPATLKSDNELLTAIDGELRADESASTGLYGLSGTSRGVRTRSAKRTSN